ncbi:MAG: EAL domain-containing response regulator [Pseudomonadota bacterium]|nr:EAL domain-containing response regulator [Pseudomonadota bacterium]
MSTTATDLGILLLEDEPRDILIEQRELKRKGPAFLARVAASKTEMIDELADFDPDVVLCDYTMLEPAVRRAFAQIRQPRAPEVRIEEPAHCDASAGLPDLGNARPRLEIALRKALLRDELTLHYQPQFDVRSGRVCGVEALARWFPADHAAIAPSVFIPLAEETGLIGDLGIWALRAACSAAVQWGHIGPKSPAISVNVSPRQICEAFTPEIARALEDTGLPANQLELEITESVLLTDIDLTLRCLTQWKSLGVRIALDDFGTGYSSLGYLARLPLDRLKMDGSLIRSMTKRSRDTTVARSVISLGRELGFTVLAEGVETEEQLRKLDELGCDQVQGYLLALPAPASVARRWMGEKWGARSASQMQRGNCQ